MLNLETVHANVYTNPHGFTIHTKPDNHIHKHIVI